MTGVTAPDCAVMCNLINTHTGKVGSDVHALIKKLTIRRVEQRSETYSNESQHLAEGMEVVRLRRRFFFVLQQVLSFCMRRHLCRQRVALAGTRQLCSQGPVSVRAHRTEGITASNGREGANGSVAGSEPGAGSETGTETGTGAREGTGT